MESNHLPRSNEEIIISFGAVNNKNVTLNVT